MAVFGKAFIILFLAVVAQGFPAADTVTNLPSMLSIASEEELGLYSKKWNMTPVQMCTLMGHQMTIAQPLLDINHPLVNHLPTIGEMAMSDAVMICEKVLNDAKGQIATVTTVVEETRQELSVPRDFLFDDILDDFTDDMMEMVGFSDDEMNAAMEENEEFLFELLEDAVEINQFQQFSADETAEGYIPEEIKEEQFKEDELNEEEVEQEDVKEEEVLEEVPPTAPPKPTLAETLGRVN